MVKRSVIMAVLVFCAGCVTDNYVTADEAQTRINAAYAAKLDQCGQNNADFFLFVINDVQEPDVRLCEAELLSAACPIKSMPASCFLLFFKKAPGSDIESRY